MDGNPSSSFRVQADKEIPTIAIRKSLAFAGNITKCLPTGTYAYIVSFENEVPLSCIARMKSISNVGVIITKLDPTGSRGTIYHPELATWSLEDIQTEISEAKVLRKLPTRDRPAPVSGRILLGFKSPTLPSKVTINILGEDVLVKLYIPGPLMCTECHVYGHHERNCQNGARCANCGLKDHSSTVCRNNPPVCKVCNRRHPLNDRSCQLWSNERKINAIRYSQKVSAQDARKIVSEQQKVTKPPALTTDNFPAIRTSKRLPLSPPTLNSPAPKRRQQWASSIQPITDATATATATATPQADTFNERIITLLENQGKLLETIATQNALILQMLVNPQQSPKPTPTIRLPHTPTTASNITVQPTPLLPTITISSPSPSVATEQSPDVNRTTSSANSQSTHLTVFNYGRDPASPSANNVGTFDFKEKN